MKPIIRILTVTLLSISLVLSLLLVLQANLPTVFAGGPWYVSPSGNNSNDCLSPDYACLTIQAAIDKAASKDTIYVAEGTYFEHLNNGGKELTIIGSGKEATIIDGGGTGQVFYDSSSSLVITIDIRDLTIQNGYASSWDGGGIYANHNLNLTNVDVLSNTTVYRGGGVYVENYANIKNCRFENNKSTNNVYDAVGGALAVKLSLTLKDTSFINNSASRGGGAIYAASIANVENAYFNSNRSTNYLGGAIHANNTLTISNTQFIANRAASGGGAIYAKGNVVVHRGYFYNNKNTGGSNGGGINVMNAFASIDSSEFISNTAGGSGSGLNISNTASGENTIENSLFARNQNTAGSAIYFYGGGGSKLTLLHDTFVGLGSGTASAIFLNDGITGITNTIITSYTTGIYKGENGTAYQDYNLFYNVAARTEGYAVGGNAHSQTGNPQFANPANNNYHILAHSAALDWGADVGVDIDFDGQPRPLGAGYDIGFDEALLIYLPIILR